MTTVPTTTTIRVSTRTHQVLVELAAATGAPIAELTAKAVERYRRELLLTRANADYAVVRTDAATAAAFDVEHEAWARLPDGLEAA